MNAEERKAALGPLLASRDRLAGLVAGLTAEQWPFREREGRWSIADCLEHVVAVETRILGGIQKQLERPAQPERQPLTEGKDSLVIARMPDRGNRIEAPEPARPAGRWPDVGELMREFHAARERTIRFVEETQGDLRNRGFAHVAFGELDCYQWLLVLGLHGERHARQIEEIKSAEAFPRT